MNRRRLLLSPLWFLVALATLIVGGTTSAHATPGLETRVRASEHVSADAVGPQVGETPGGVGCLRPAESVFVVGACVATNTAPQVLTNKAIGDAAADGIASQYPGALREVTLQASSGTRRLDVLTPQGLAIESKVGRTSLTKATRQQIQRDVELLNDPLSPVTSVDWVFSVSPITGRGGPTGPLEAALRAAGIGIR